MRHDLTAYVGAVLTGCAATIASLVIVTACTPGTGGGPAPSPSPGPTVTVDPDQPLGDVALIGGFGFSYDDGLVVNVLAVSQYMPGPEVHDAGAGRQAYIVEVAVENSTDGPVPVEGTTVRAFAGPVLVESPPIVDPSRTALLGGEVPADALVAGTYVFAAPVVDAARVEVLVEVPGREPVTFVRG